MDLKPSVFALNQPANSSDSFLQRLRRRDEHVSRASTSTSNRGSATARSSRPASRATARTLDNCNLLAAGFDAVDNAASGNPILSFMGTETYADGSRACHREYPYRPDVKMSGSYTLPWDIQLAGTFQHSRGIQTGGAGPSLLANWTLTSAVAAPMIGRNWTGVASRIVGLMWRRPGLRQAQPEPAGYQAGEALHRRQGPAARRLRPLQPVQQQLAVHA